MAGMSSLAMAKLKGLLQEQVFKQDAARASGSSAAVIEAVRKAHPEAVEAASLELENATMARMLSHLAARHPNEDESGEPSLFSDYPGVRQFIMVTVERDGESVPEWRPIEHVTLSELGTWIAEDRRTETTRRQREPAMAKLLRDCSEVAKGRKDMTIGEAMKLRRARGGK
jgi:type II secretory pathway component PulJ